MKKVNYSDSSQVVGDEVADVLLEYAAALATHQASEPVKFRAVGTDGGEVDASFLLGPASQIAVEEADDGPEPRNDEAIDFMRERIRALGSGARPQAEQQPSESVLDGYDV